MSKKLFSLEEALPKDESNDLLIDKILNKAKEPKSPLSLTSDILKQRQEIKKDIEDKLTDEPKEDEDTSEEDETTEEEKDTSSDGATENDEESTKDTEPSSDKSKEEKEEDIGEAAEDKDSLNNLIGSGLKEATESFSNNKVKTTKTISLKEIFSPILKAHKQYTQSLEKYSLESLATPVSKQPVAYVKESVIESLTNLTTLANSYINNNNNFIKVTSESVKKINERFSVFNSVVEAEKFSFTNKLINDKDILSNFSSPGNSDPRDNLRELITYIDKSNKAVSLLLSNDFKDISSSFLNNDFSTEGSDIVYKKVLPGFNLVKLHLDTYKTYLSVNPTNFQYYKLKVLKTEDLFDLNSIGVTEDKELKYILDSFNKLLVSISLGVDNLNTDRKSVV